MSAKRDPNVRPWNVQCPTCLASRGEPCRSLGTRRVTDTHEARRRKSWGKWVAS